MSKFEHGLLYLLVNVFRFLICDSTMNNADRKTWMEWTDEFLAGLRQKE